MRKTLSYAAAAAAALTMVISCSKEKRDFPIMMNVTSTGKIIGDTFTDDDGISYEIVQKGSEVKVEDMDRALVIFDVLSKTGDKQYDIRLNYLHKPLCKTPVKVSEASDEQLVNDPIYINQGWISGGYINLGFVFSHMMQSDVKHMINLVMEERQKDDTLRFTLHHNGYGEGFADEGNRSDYTESAGFACFSLSGILPEGSEAVPVKITAPWYVTVGDDIRTGETFNLVTRGMIRR